MAAFLVAALTLVCVQRAFAATTVPNASRTTLNLAANATSAPISIASLTSPVQILAGTPTWGYTGACQLTVMYSPSGGFFQSVLAWSGTEMRTHSSDTQFSVSGFSRELDYGIAAIGYQGTFPITIALDSSGNPTKICVTNNTPSGLAGTAVLTQIW